MEKLIKHALRTGCIAGMMLTISACSQSGVDLLPKDVRAKLAADAAKDAPPKTVEDILRSARSEEPDKEGGKTVLKKTKSRFSKLFNRKKNRELLNPPQEVTTALKKDHDPIADFLGGDEITKAETTIAKTKDVDTITTASVSKHAKKKRERSADAIFARRAEMLRRQADAKEGRVKKVNTASLKRNAQRIAKDGKPTNAEIAKNWVETGPEDLEGLPVADLDAKDIQTKNDANKLFAAYIEKTKSSVDNDALYERRLAKASKNATYEQNAADLFKKAEAIRKTQANAQASPAELLKKSQKLAERNQKAAQSTSTSIFKRASALLKKQKKTIPSSKTLAFNGASTELSAQQQTAIKAFVLAHPGKDVTISAGPGTIGSSYERLAVSQARMRLLKQQMPALKSMKTVIKPDIKPNTIRLDVQK